MEQLYRSNHGFAIYRNQPQDTVWVQFDHGRLVAGNAPLNGGIHGHITALLNHTLPPVATEQDLPGGNMAAYLKQVAQDRGLNPDTAAGLLTAARMKNCSVQHLHFRRLEVAAVITAGVDINGGRAGDPAAYYERQGQFHPLGTINILLVINANLPHQALIKAIITATEAKTAALQELIISSQYSTGLATGTGTDGVIAAADPDTDFVLTDAGLHSKLGELIGRVVKDGVKQALAQENELTVTRQNHLLTRLNRFGVHQNHLWSQFNTLRPNTTKLQYAAALEQLTGDPNLAAAAGALLHLQDEINWGLLPPQVAFKTSRRILTALSPHPPPWDTLDLNHTSVADMLVQWINNMVLDQLR